VTNCILVLFLAFSFPLIAAPLEDSPQEAPADPREGSQAAVQETAEPADGDEEDGEEEEAQQPARRSVMDLLRERIEGTGGTPIDILSRGSMETSGDWVTVREDAEISYGGTTILADLITFNQSNYLLRAEGNVVMIGRGLRIGGESMEFDLRAETGSVENAYVETEDGFILTGRMLRKYAADRFRIDGARITTCTQPTPYWTLRASSIDFEVNKAATMSNARFNLGAVPLFYTPWLRVPMNNERSSGILMPTWGSSDFHGFFVNTGYFWAINRSHDAAFALDYYDLRGWRYGAEYRNNLGNSNFSHAYIHYIDDEEYGRRRYEGRVRGRQALPGGFVASGDLQFLSDLHYRRDFINHRIHYSPLFRRAASLAKSFGVYSLSVGYNDLNRFLGSNRIREIRYLPVVDFRAREQRLPLLPVYFSFSANYARPAIINRQIRLNADDLVNSNEYHRLDLTGTLQLPIKTFAPWLTVTPVFTARDTEYSKRYSSKKERIVNRRHGRRYYDVGVQMTGPVFSRIFGGAEQHATRYKHVIEPRLSYRWRSDIERPERIIVVDQVDTFFKVHELRWELHNRLLRKRSSPRNPQGEIVEVLKISLSQYVTLDDELQTTYNQAYVFDPTALEISGRFSPLQIYAVARFSRLFSTSARLEYSFTANSFVSYIIGANLRHGSLRYNFGYYKTLRQFVNNLYYRAASNRLVTNGSFDALGGLLSIRGAFDYDFARRRILNYMAGFDINGQCMGFRFDMRKLNILGQQDIQIRFGITIGGLRALLSPEEGAFSRYQ